MKEAENLGKEIHKMIEPTKCEYLLILGDFIDKAWIHEYHNIMSSFFAGLKGWIKIIYIIGNSEYTLKPIDLMVNANFKNGRAVYWAGYKIETSRFIFSHAPIELKDNRLNIHGHLHTNHKFWVEPKNHINVNMTAGLGKPIFLSDLLKEAQKTDKRNYKIENPPTLKDMRKDEAMRPMYTLYKNYSLAEANMDNVLYLFEDNLSTKSQVIIAYHTSSKKFDKFDISKVNTGTNDGGMWGDGLYFTDSEKAAKIFNKSGYLYKVELKFEHPYICNNESERNKLMRFLKCQMKGDRNITDMKDFFEQGYDSIISNNEPWDNSKANQYIAFKNDQIKILEVTKYLNDILTEEGSMEDLAYLFNESIEEGDTFKLFENAILVDDEREKIADVLNQIKDVVYGFISKKDGARIDNRDWIHNCPNLGDYYSVNRDPEVTLKNKLGICQDQSILIRHLLNKYHPDLKVQLYAMTTGRYGHCVPTFCDCGKYYYLENAWDKEMGLHGGFDSKEELERYLSDIYHKHHDKDTGGEEVIVEPYDRYETLISESVTKEVIFR